MTKSLPGTRCFHPIEESRRRSNTVRSTSARVRLNARLSLLSYSRTDRSIIEFPTRVTNVFIDDRTFHVLVAVREITSRDDRMARKMPR